MQKSWQIGKYDKASAIKEFPVSRVDPVIIFTE